MARTQSEIEVLIWNTIRESSYIGSLAYNILKATFIGELVRVIAYAHETHEAITEENAKNSRVYNQEWWYAQISSYLDGVPTRWSERLGFHYETEGIEDIEARKVIKRHAVLRNKDGEVVIKVATLQDEELVPLPDDVFSRFKYWVENEISPMGTKFEFVNRPADQLKIELDVYVDMNLFNADGVYLGNSLGEKPVELAVAEYLANIKFNGEFVKTFLVDRIQDKLGVRLPLVKQVQWQYASLPWTTVGERIASDSGYFKVQELIINYLPDDLAQH